MGQGYPGSAAVVRSWSDLGNTLLIGRGQQGGRAERQLICPDIRCVNLHKWSRQCRLRRSGHRVCVTLV